MKTTTDNMTEIARTKIVADGMFRRNDLGGTDKSRVHWCRSNCREFTVTDMLELGGSLSAQSFTGYTR